MLTNEESGVAERVGPAYGFIIVDGDDDRAGRTQHDATPRRIAQRHDETLAAAFRIRIIDDRYREGGERLTRRKMQCAGSSFVVAWSRGAACVNHTAITAARRIERRIIDVSGA